MKVSGSSQGVLPERMRMQADTKLKQELLNTMLDFSS
jgi:hypothetical protein